MAPSNTTKQPVLAYILKGYPRISETFISNEILLLEQLGFTLRLFPMRKPREDFSHESVKRITAKVSYLPTHLFRNIGQLLVPNMLLALKRPKRYFRALAIAGSRYLRTRKIATLKHLFQAGYMTEKFLLREPEISHLHGHFAHSPTSVTMFASILSGLPFSFTAHAKDIYTSNPAQLKEKIDKARFVATCTKVNLKYLGDLAGEVTTPIHCVYHGINLDLFQNTETKYVATNPYKLLTVARMTEKKGLPTVYRALAKLRDQGVVFEHNLIGDGDDREKVLALIEELQLTDQCKWLGTKTHEEVLKQFKVSDLFVLGCEIAGNGDRDGIPNVLVESVAMGVPALSTTVSAIPEILLHEKTGITVPPSDPDILAESMVRILQDTDLRTTLIDEGRALVNKSFDNKKLAHDLAAIFLAENPDFRAEQ